MSAGYHGRSKITMGSYTRTKYEYDASVWCLENDICITPRQSQWGIASWCIDIETGKYPNRKLIGTSPESYSKNTIWEKVTEYQKYYYEKYKD